MTCCLMASTTMPLPGTKPSPEPMLISHLMRFCGLHLRAVSQWMLKLLFNSLALGRFDYSLKLIDLLISTINILSIFCEIAIMWMPQHLTDHQSTLVQVMAWCRQATSHYLSQCWPRSLSPYDVTRPKWLNEFKNCSHIFRGPMS